MTKRLQELSWDELAMRPRPVIRKTTRGDWLAFTGTGVKSKLYFCSSWSEAIGRVCQFVSKGGK